MATFDDLLDKYIDDNEPLFTINRDIRSITIPEGYSILGVTNDMNTRCVKFQCPRYYGHEDLSEYTIYVNYVNSNGDGDVYLVEYVNPGEHSIEFHWIVGRTAFEQEGTVSFTVVFRKYDENNYVVNEFNTAIASMQVLPGLDVSPAVVEDYSDIINQMISQWRSQIEDTTNEMRANVDQLSMDIHEELSEASSEILVNVEALTSEVREYLEIDSNVKLLEKKIDLLSDKLTFTNHTNSDSDIIKITPSNASMYARVDKLGGKSISIVNVLDTKTYLTMSAYGVTKTVNSDGSITLSGYSNASGYIPLTSPDDKITVEGHVYAYDCVWLSNDRTSEFWFSVAGQYSSRRGTRVFKETRSGDHESYIRLTFDEGSDFNGTYKFYPLLLDLTQMFGPGNEPEQIELTSMFKFDEGDLYKRSDISLKPTKVISRPQNIWNLQSSFFSICDPDDVDSEMIQLNRQPLTKVVPEQEYVLSCDFSGVGSLEFLFETANWKKKVTLSNDEPVVVVAFEYSSMNVTVKSIGYVEAINVQLNVGPERLPYRPFAKDVIDEFQISDFVLEACPDYDLEGNYLDIKNRKYIRNRRNTEDGVENVIPPSEIDVSNRLGVDNWIKVEPGGYLEFPSGITGCYIPPTSSITYAFPDTN